MFWKKTHIRVISVRNTVGDQSVPCDITKSQYVLKLDQVKEQMKGDLINEPLHYCPHASETTTLPVDPDCLIFVYHSLTPVDYSGLEIIFLH